MNSKKIGAVFCVLAMLPFTALASNYTKNMRSMALQSSSNQYLVAASNASLAITGNMTVEAWVKFDSVPTTDGVMAIVNKADGTWPGNSYGLLLVNNAGVSSLFFGIVTGGLPTQGMVDWSPVVGTWYHIAVAYNTNGSATFYVNGDSIGTVTGLGTSIQASNANFCIGQDCAGHYFFDGSIDEVRLYNITRSQGDIQSDYLHEVTGTEAGLVGYWQLDKDLIDETNNNNDLTAVNNPQYSNDKPFAR